MKAKVTSSYFRGVNRCNIRRKHETLANLQTAKNSIYYDNAIVIKDILNGYFDGEFQTSEFADLVSQGTMTDDEVISSEQKRDQQNRIVRLLNRAVLSETRKLKKAPRQTIEFEDYEVSLKPDRYYDDGNNIEVIIYRAGKPSVKQKGRVQDGGATNCIELYLMLKYARTLIPAGETRTVSASYYFLRKDTDTKLGIMDNDFFSGNGGNVVTLSDPDAYLGGSDSQSEMDLKLKELYEEFAKGNDQCSEKDCEECSLKAACHYQKISEEKKEDKKLSSKKGKIAPSKEQANIISFRRGVGLSCSTAGSGKTETAMERTAMMLEEGVKPEEILMITFTDNATNEMLERLVKKCEERDLPYTKDDFNIMTFHRLCHKILVENAKECGFDKLPKILQNNDVENYDIVAKLLEENHIAGLDYMNFKMSTKSVKGALPLTVAVMAVIKDNRLNLDDIDIYTTLKELLREKGLYRFMADSSVMEFVDFAKKYDEVLRKNALATFADLEIAADKFLSVYPGYMDGYGFKHVVIDESQDTSDFQFKLVKMLKDAPCRESLLVIGDDSQSIYKFRNANNSNIVNFFERIGVDKVVSPDAPLESVGVNDGIRLDLSSCYRCVGEIVDLARKVNDLNEEKLDKKIIAVREDGLKPVFKGFHSKKMEAEYIAANIKKQIDEGVNPEDIAFLSYKRSECVTVAAELSKLDIPWVIRNPLKLKDNSRVQAAISLAEAFYQPDAENLYFNFLCAKHNGDIFQEDEIQVLAEIKALKSQFENIDSLDIEAQRHIFHDMLDSLKNNGEDEIYEYFLSLLYDKEDFQSELEFIHKFTIYGDNMERKMDQKVAAVSLSTVHSAKGLEWPVVFLSMSAFDNEGLHHGRNKKENIEEVRRLLFVAITRAKDKLAITSQFEAYSNTVNGEKDITYNQFVRELHEVMGMEYDPIDKIAYMKDQLKAAKKKKPAKGNEMTPEQIEAYEKLIAGAEQISFAW